MRGSWDWSEEQLQRAFAEGLQEASNVAKCWNERPWTVWTQLASAALGSAAGKAASDRGGIGDIQVAWKGHPDAHGRSEYLTWMSLSTTMTTGTLCSSLPNMRTTTMQRRWITDLEATPG